MGIIIGNIKGNVNVSGAPKSLDSTTIEGEFDLNGTKINAFNKAEVRVPITYKEGKVSIPEAGFISIENGSVNIGIVNGSIKDNVIKGGKTAINGKVVTNEISIEDAIKMGRTK